MLRVEGPLSDLAASQKILRLKDNMKLFLSRVGKANLWPECEYWLNNGQIVLPFNDMVVREDLVFLNGIIIPRNLILTVAMMRRATVVSGYKLLGVNIWGNRLNLVEPIDFTDSKEQNWLKINLGLEGFSIFIYVAGAISVRRLKVENFKLFNQLIVPKNQAGTKDEIFESVDALKIYLAKFSLSENEVDFLAKLIYNEYRDLQSVRINIGRFVPKPERRRKAI